MTTMSAFRTFEPVKYVHKIRQMAENSWWVYRQEIGQMGRLQGMPRVVFFGRSQQQVENWMEKQREEMIFVLSEN